MAKAVDSSRVVGRVVGVGPYLGLQVWVATIENTVAGAHMLQRLVFRFACLIQGWYNFSSWAVSSVG
jgi:hypothetical protein